MQLDRSRSLDPPDLFLMQITTPTANRTKQKYELASSPLLETRLVLRTERRNGTASKFGAQLIRLV